MDRVGRHDMRCFGVSIPFFAFPYPDNVNILFLG